MMAAETVWPSRRYEAPDLWNAQIQPGYRQRKPRHPERSEGFPGEAAAGDTVAR